MLASIAHRTPPRSYGPWEQVASTLTEGLVARGHDVTLVRHRGLDDLGAPACRAPAGYEEDPAVDAKVCEAPAHRGGLRAGGDFDVISNQFDFLPLSYSRLTSTPVVTTIHGFSSERIVPVYAAYDDIGHYVAISDATAIPRSPTPRRSTTASTWTPSPAATATAAILLFLGRIHPDKGASRPRGGPAGRDPAGHRRRRA